MIKATIDNLAEYIEDLARTLDNSLTGIQNQDLNPAPITPTLTLDTCLLDVPTESLSSETTSHTILYA